MYGDFFLKFIYLFKEFNKYAIPVGLLLSILVYKDLREFMIPIAILYYTLVGIILLDKRRNKNLSWRDPNQVILIDIIYISLMACVCYGWFRMILYIGGIQYE